MRYFVSDLHFSHTNVISYCNRPYASTHEMNLAIIDQWNSQVGPEDEVYFLGDFGIVKKKILDEKFVSKLNGKKHAIIGNHDSGYNTLHKKEGKLESTINKYRKAGWESVQISLSVKLKNGIYVTMTHLPPSGEHDDRYSQYKIKNDAICWYLHGHLHAIYRKNKNMIDVAFDGGLKLHSEDDIIALIEDEREYIPSSITEFYNKTKGNSLLKPYELEVGKKYLRKSEDSGLVLYNYTDKCVYDKAWNETTLSARGIVFEKATGELIALPFPKFFNLGEREETMLNNLPVSNFVCSEKLDGSLGIVYWYKGKWRIATRGSLNSDQAKKAEEMLHSKYNPYVFNKRRTYLVEIIYPENKIVVDYGKDEKLVLLGIMDLDLKEEIPLNASVVKYIPEVMCGGLEYAEFYEHSIPKMIELQKSLPKDKEGFVVRFENGLRVKIKGQEYIKIHKMISHMTPLAFWETMVDGKVNVDYLEQLPEEFRKEADELTKTLELSYSDTHDSILKYFNEVKMSVDTSDMKSVGLYVKGSKHEHKSLIFPLILNKKKVVDKYIMRYIRPNGNSFKE